MNKRGRVQRRGLLGLGLTALALATPLAITGGRALAAGGRAAPATRKPSQQTVETTALVASAISTPMGVLGDDGMEHIAYDLTLTNVAAGTVTLSAVEVIDLDNGRTRTCGWVALRCAPVIG